jgi:hypothetical protein
MAVSADNTAGSASSADAAWDSALANRRTAASVDVRSSGLWQLAAGHSYLELRVLASWRRKNCVVLVAPGTLRQKAGSTPASADRCFIASNAKRAPRCGVLAAGVDPPNT